MLNMTRMMYAVLRALKANETKNERMRPRTLGEL